MVFTPQACTQIFQHATPPLACRGPAFAVALITHRPGIYAGVLADGRQTPLFEDRSILTLQPAGMSAAAMMAPMATSPAACCPLPHQR